MFDLFLLHGRGLSEGFMLFAFATRSWYVSMFHELVFASRSWFVRMFEMFLLHGGGLSEGVCHVFVFAGSALRAQGPTSVVRTDTQMTKT